MIKIQYITNVVSIHTCITSLTHLITIHRFKHESAQCNNAGHLIYENVFKTTRPFCYLRFRVTTLQANATKHGKSTLNLCIVFNRKKCKRFLNSKPIMRWSYIHTFIYERSFLACQNFKVSNFFYYEWFIKWVRHVILLWIDTTLVIYCILIMISSFIWPCVSILLR